jgi:Xaa-Pro aminopeptidase
MLSMYSSRISRIQSRLEAEGLDALLVTSLPNIRYLSGFSGSTGLLLIGRNGNRFISDFRYHEQYTQEVDPAFELLDNTGKDLVKEVLPAFAAEGIRRIGYESDHVSGTTAGKISTLQDAQLTPTTLWVEELRMVKDEQELAAIEAAIRLNEEVFSEVLQLASPDITEADLAAEIFYRGMKKGADGVSFSPIVASGANSAKPHAGFSTSRVVPGTPLTFDMGMKLNGYCSDMTRTVFVGDCPEQWRRVYDIVREAKDRAADAIRPGLTGRQVDAVARDYITEQGHGEHFGHGLGHGIGIEVHEAPRLARVSETVLQPGHVVTNEPGVYLPGEGGIRIEDIFIVTEGGAKNMNALSTDVMVVG